MGTLWLGVTSAPPRREFGVSAPMQRGAHFFEEIAFPCSVALKVLGATSAAVRSRIGFCNIWSFVIFFVLPVSRCGALFSNI